MGISATTWTPPRAFFTSISCCRMRSVVFAVTRMTRTRMRAGEERGTDCFKNSTASARSVVVPSSHRKSPRMPIAVREFGEVTIITWDAMDTAS